MSRTPRSVTRREFLSNTTQAGLVLAAASPVPVRGAVAGRQPATSAALDALRRVLTEPSQAAKPMTRWWWFSAITPQEVTRELTFMRDAGLRGAEIQPVYPVTVDDPSRGLRNLRYYSTEWFDVVRHAVHEAKRLNLQLDSTWLRTPLFTTTLEMMKAATDSTLLDGINHIVNHGSSYSPPEAGAPGWAFYASTEVNHTQTWWRHYPHLARYVQRACAALREGVSVNPVLVCPAPLSSAVVGP